MKNIYVVTHTEALHHVQGLGGGWYDTPLTDKGKAQAVTIAKNLQIETKLSGITIYSSDLERARETADKFAGVFGSRVIIDKNLREMNYGDGGGKDKEWQTKNLIPLFEDTNLLDYRRFKNAESRRECGTRANIFIEKLLKNPDSDIIVITHGFMRTFLILAWLKVPLENMGYADFGCNSGSVSLLSENDLFKSRILVYVNRMDFLNG